MSCVGLVCSLWRDEFLRNYAYSKSIRKGSSNFPDKIRFSIRKFYHFESIQLSKHEFLTINTLKFCLESLKKIKWFFFFMPSAILFAVECPVRSGPLLRTKQIQKLKHRLRFHVFWPFVGIEKPGTSMLIRFCYWQCGVEIIAKQQ